MQEGFRQGGPEVKLEDLGPGIKGRTIPPEEMELKPEQIEKLIKDFGEGSAMADFIRGMYAKRQPSISLKDRVVGFFTRG